MTAKAHLAVVSTPIGNVEDLSHRAVDVLSVADLIFCEDTRHSGMLLSRVGVEIKHLVSLNAHNEAARITTAVDALAQGKTIALVSDAGTPLVSDPGAHLVDAVIDSGFPVIPIPGPSAALAALVVSGFDTSRFSFFGFMPKSGAARKEFLGAIAASTYPSIVFESPKRLAVTLTDLVDVAGPERRVVVARELTKMFEETWRGPLQEALERARTAEPVGEHVLVVEGRTARIGIDETTVRAALSALVDEGLTLADAARAVEVLLGARHRLVYEQRLALGEKAGSGGREVRNATRKANRGRPVR
ncbi:MAG: 16S rRNA (cytidine(1402)-2'-O)-methyltransferase [Acidimicrobiales bacterium]